MAATLVMAPLVWSRMLAADTRFGHCDQLRSAWAAVCRGMPTLSAAPVEGLRELTGFDHHDLHGLFAQAQKCC